MEDIRKGPWTNEEDYILFNFVNTHGAHRWNSVPSRAGLNRTGKSCRLRWLNYLRPNIRHGNITLQEQLLILQLYFQWGNRWSKIAEFLPGRTDNEIKNYWRTRVVKQAQRLHYDVNSQQFRDVMRDIWMPRLLERIQASSEPHSGPSSRPEWVNPISMSKISSETSVDVQAPSLLNSIPCYDLSGCGTSELDIISLDDGSGYCQACDGF